MDSNRREFIARGAALCSNAARQRCSCSRSRCHQVQPCGGERYAQGAGRRTLQERARGKAAAGRIKVEVYPNSTLYKDKEELEALQLGAVQMLAPSLSKFGPLGARQFELFDLPYLFADEAAFHRVVDGPVGKQLVRPAQRARHSGAGVLECRVSCLFGQPARSACSLKDLRGLKMRIPSSKVLEANLRALGALPQILAFS